MAGLYDKLSPEEVAWVSETVVTAASRSLVERGATLVAALSTLASIGANAEAIAAAAGDLVPDPGVYAVEVEVSTHDLLQEGVTAMRRQVPSGLDYSIVYVSGRDVRTDSEAMLVAAQIATCTSGGMPTRTTLVSFPG